MSERDIEEWAANFDWTISTITSLCIDYDDSNQERLQKKRDMISKNSYLSEPSLFFKHHCPIWYVCDIHLLTISNFNVF